MHWIWHQRETGSGLHVPDAEGRGRWAVLQFFTCQVCWVWLHFSFNSGHTCPKIQELKHSKVNSVSSSVHESPCCFLFISEKNGEVNCTLFWAYLWQEREISVHHLKARESLPVRGHTLWGGGREAEPCQRGEVICGSPVQQIQEIKTKIHINELTWIRTLWSKLLL